MFIRYVRNDELYHFRTKGSKNGRRLYQNEDGSLTPAGRERYLKDPSAHRGESSGGNKKMTNSQRRKKMSEMSDEELKKDNMRNAAEKTYAKNHSTVEEDMDKYTNDLSKNVDDTFRKGKNAYRTVKDIKSSKRQAEQQRLLTEKIKTMSNEQLQKEVNRMNLEQQYARLSSGTVTKGRDKVMDILDITGDILGVVGGAIAIGGSLYKFSKLFK